MSTRIFRKGKEFPEADVKKEARAFAEWAHKYFVQHEWIYAEIDFPGLGFRLTNEHIPSVDELEKLLNDLYFQHKRSWTKWGMSAGRLRVQCNNSICRFYIMD